MRSKKQKNNKKQRREIMNKSLYFNIFSFGFLVSLLLTNEFVQAQNKAAKDHNEQVVIIGSTDPTVNQSRKINLMPEEPVQPKIKKDFTFVPINKYFYTPSKFTPIKPASFSSYVAEDIYNNVIKAGFGTRLSPYAEFFHSQAHKRKYKFDFHALHHSTFGKVKGFTPAPASNSLAEAGYTQYFKKHTLEFNAGYQYRNNRNYLDTALVYDENNDTLKLAYNLFFFNTSYSSNYKNNRKLHHQVNVGGYYFFNKRQQDFYTQADELNVQTDFDFHKAFRVTDVLDYQHMGGAGKIEYFRNNGIINPINSTVDSLPANDILVSLTPYFKARYGIISFKAGINFSYLYAVESGHFRIFPDLTVNVNLLPEYLELYAGADGGYQKNSYKRLTTENPFIAPGIPGTWKTDKFRIYGGFKGNIAKKVGFNMQIAWSAFDNEYFYLSLYDKLLYLSNFNNNFLVINDNGKLLSFNTQLTYNVTDNFNFYAAYQYNSYTLDSLSAATGKLRSQLKAGGSVLIRNRFKPWIEVVYVGKRDALSVSSAFSAIGQIELDGFTDISLGMDYYHNENFSAFLNITNLLNKKYEYFYHHPTYGVEVMLGVGYKF